MNNFGDLGKDNPLPRSAGRSLRSLTRNLQELNLYGNYCRCGFISASKEKSGYLVLALL